MTCVTKAHFPAFQVSCLPFTTESLSEICETKLFHSEGLLKSCSVIILEYYCLLAVRSLFKGQGLTQYFSQTQTNMILYWTSQKQYEPWLKVHWCNFMFF